MARAQRTYLARRTHTGPLIVQRPFYPEGPVCHVYIVHPPGGVVGGDRLDLSIHACPASHVLVTTPAATKFYRNAGRIATVEQNIQLDRATLEWLPQEAIVFPDSSVRLKTRVQLCEHSRFIGWDISCYGRPAAGLQYTQGQVFQDLELWSADVPALIDRFRLDSATQSMQSAFGLAGHPVLATLLAYPADENLLQAARQAGVSGVTSACTRIGRTLLCRAVSHHVSAVRRLFEEIWMRLRPMLIGRTAAAPRIWAT